MNPFRRKLLTQGSLGAAGAILARRVRADEGESEIIRCRPLPPAKPADVGPGKKFSADGTVQHYPGNTIICHIPKSGVFDELKRVIEALRVDLGTQNLSWLPPESYHMTVFDGVTNAYRRPGDWPQMLPLDASMDACNSYVAKRLRKLDLGFVPPIRMVVNAGDVSRLPGSFPLRPVDAAENNSLRELRDRIALAIGVRHENHDSYRFHTTFAYYVRPFAADEDANYQLAYVKAAQRLRKAVPVIELNAPEYCLFEDMAAFRTQFILQAG